MPNENNRLQYSELGNNLRLYSNMRFAQMTLFLALTALLFGGLRYWREFPEVLEPPLTVDSIVLIRVGGFLLSLLLWIWEERTSDYWHYYADLASSLEGNLPCKIYENRPTANFVSATNAARLIYFAATFLWSWSAFVTFGAFIVSIGLVLFLFYRVWKCSQPYKEKPKKTARTDDNEAGGSGSST